MEKASNSKGTVWYGLHFYPGVAEYQEPGKDSYRVFLNEDTLRSMDPTFAGCPIFVDHVDGVDESIDEVRKEAEGWVLESFYNKADAKHWVKFVTVTERAARAIKNGMRLSNAYIPKSFSSGGNWNGVSFSREITGGEYEHLAIVKNPRYEESIIMTPEQFKKYNEAKEVELKRLSNSKEEGTKKMGLNFWSKKKVENSLDLESTGVTLPKSGKEMTIAELVEQADRIENMHGYANMDHMVKVGEEEMNVGVMIKKYMSACNELAELKKPKEEKEEGEEDDEKKNKKKNEADPKEKEEAEKLRNAADKVPYEPAKQKEIELMVDKLARGKELF